MGLRLRLGLGMAGIGKETGRESWLIESDLIRFDFIWLQYNTCIVGLWGGGVCGGNTFLIMGGKTIKLLVTGGGGG